jgi:endonuclease YncB( thermonuclease family)
MSADHQTVLDVIATAFTLGAPILLQVLADKHKARIECQIVDVIPGSVVVLHPDGSKHTYRLVEIDAEVAA